MICGSGKLGTPWARMHLAAEIACDSVCAICEADSRGPWGRSCLHFWNAL